MGGTLGVGQEAAGSVGVGQEGGRWGAPWEWGRR